MSQDGDGSKLGALLKLWWLWLLLLGVGFAIGIGRSAGPTPNAPQTAASKADATQNELREALDQGLARQRSTDEGGEKTPDQVIASHQEKLAKLEQEPDAAPEESAALLSALGNLHLQKKRDYATAARYYEQLIQEYPEWPGVNAIYHQLIKCYTELKDQQSLRVLYRKMLDVFPQASKEYEYANAALSGQLSP